MPDVTMPRLSDTMQEGKIARWLKQPGEPVRRGDVLAEIETDKATMELEAYDAGVLERVLVQEGQTVPIGQAIAVIGTGAGAPSAPAQQADQASAEAGQAQGAPTATARPVPAEAEITAAAPSGEPSAATSPGPAPQETRPPAGTPPVGEASAAVTAGPTPAPQPAAQVADDDQVKASPMARAIARERGIELRRVQGTGPGGRIIRADVESLRGDGRGMAVATGDGGGTPSAVSPAAPAAAAAAQPATQEATASAPTAPPPAAPAAPPGVSPEDVELRPVGRIHQVMAERTHASVRDIPQYYLTAEIDMHAGQELRRQLEDAYGKEARVTINALILRAVALALREVPEVNSTWRDGEWLVHRRVHLGVAVAIPDGLIVPVIRDADQKSLRDIATESRSLAGRAREGKLSLAEMQGSTFTVTNLGMFEVEEFHGIINPPEAGLLAVGTVVEKPVGLDGQIVLRPRMRVTLSADHRAYSGDVGARFLQSVKRLLEQPLRLGF